MDMEVEEPTTMMADEVMEDQQPAAAAAIMETDAPPARLMITKMVRPSPLSAIWCLSITFFFQPLSCSN
jgi:hypothetical protein